MSEWKPGDLAMVTWPGNVDGEFAVVRGDRHWHYLDDVRDHHVFNDGWLASQSATARPLVVIDPEDDKEFERLLALFHRGWRNDQGHRNALKSALREFARPSIEEPQGLGAVVEDVQGAKWVRSRKGVLGLLGVVWENPTTLAHRAWQGIDAVRILTPGIPS